MNVSVTRYSTVCVFGQPDPAATVERYLYDHTKVIVREGDVFVLGTTAAFECADSLTSEALDRAKTTSQHLRRYQLDRFESGLYPTAVFSTFHAAHEAAIEASLVAR